MRTILHCSLAQKLDCTSLSYPSDIRGVAMELDTILWDLLEHTTRLHIPKGEEGLGVKCVRDPQLAGKEFPALACPPASQAGWAGAQVAGGD